MHLVEGYDLVVTNPTYSGMNQRLKIGKEKIIGQYSKLVRMVQSDFEEFHDTQENYIIAHTLVGDSLFSIK